MIYIVLFLFIIGYWQSTAKGRISPMISAVSFLSAIILLVVGLMIGQIEMQIILFAIFLLASIFILMQLYGFSTYHKYFPIMAPVLIVYGAVVGYLLIVFNFSEHFLDHVILTLAFLTINYRKQQQASIVSLLAENNEQEKILEKSTKNTIKFHMFSSIVYVASLIISFLYFYNESGFLKGFSKTAHILAR